MVCRMATRVLLVDDHRILRDGLRLRLQHEDAIKVIGEAATVREAYHILEQQPVDVVVMDLNMPDVNGLAATARIRQLWPAVRIVVLTGDASETAPNDAILAGAHGFIRKEDTSDELVRAIQTVIAGKVYLSPDAATAIARGLVSRPESTGAPELSERELAVLKGVAAGLSYKEIASELQVSVKSVETYRARLVKKTGCNTRADLVRYAIRIRLVEA